jgi:putative membrane protein
MKLILKAASILPVVLLSMPLTAFADATSSSILSTIITIDQNEVLASVQAVNKDAGPAVTDFANMMIKDHGKNMTDALALASKIHALPLNPNPNDLHNKGSHELQVLAADDSSAYDKAFADAMVKGHTDALAMIDHKFLKMAKNEDLKSFLTDTRAAVAHHLEEAKKLQDSLKS